jgi:hypothetical protein
MIACRQLRVRTFGSLADVVLPVSTSGPQCDRIEGDKRKMSGPETGELVLQRPPTLGRSAIIEGLRSALRGAPVFSLLVLTVAIVCAIFAPLIAPGTTPLNRGEMVMA